MIFEERMEVKEIVIIEEGTQASSLICEERTKATSLIYMERIEVKERVIVEEGVEAT